MNRTVAHRRVSRRLEPRQGQSLRLGLDHKEHAPVDNNPRLSRVFVQSPSSLALQEHR